MDANRVHWMVSEMASCWIETAVAQVIDCFDETMVVTGVDSRAGWMYVGKAAMGPGLVAAK